MRKNLQVIMRYDDRDHRATCYQEAEGIFTYRTAGIISQELNLNT